MLVRIDPDPIRVNQIGSLHVTLDSGDVEGTYFFGVDDEVFPDGTTYAELTMEKFRDYDIEVRFAKAGGLTVNIWKDNRPPDVNPPAPFDSIPLSDVLEEGGVEPAFNVALVPPGPPKSYDEVLWYFIKANSRRMRFDEFRDFVQPKLPTNSKAWFGVAAYTQLRSLADDFVARTAIFDNVNDPELSEKTVNEALKVSYVSDVPSPAKPYLDYPYGPPASTAAGGPAVPPPAPLPAAAPPLAHIQTPSSDVQFPLKNIPFVELIWNYWTEEGMLVQTLNHILARFQNRRSSRGSDPLLRLDLSPLMPLRTLLWGFAEDESGRLTVRRRAAEYEYEYGLRLRGRAIPDAGILADRRARFLEGFHRLLHACVLYYKERDDKTVDADAFPLLSNLQEVHLVLARGAHNQFANLAPTARAEMLTMQWILAQPEMHEFLGGPVMVPYEEPWMDRVDTMKTLQGWSDTSITHFFELAVQGEQILLSVRHGRWNESTRTREDAANWALTWRNSIQRYIHSYATVTGRDLTIKVDAAMPSDLIARRMSDQRSRA
ncbi:hypothetical protein [Mycolicibacterium sp.]|uniref:hypothetical protein n=1 Tax=Mycolicibacterium sp. TaxID=2320850 RepID=UPI0037C51B46